MAILCSRSPGSGGRHDAGTKANSRSQVAGDSARKAAADGPRSGRGKWLLRRVLDRYVPRSLIDRPKMGFGVPIDAWLRGPLREWAESLLAPARLASDGFVRVAPVRQAWQEHLEGTRNWQYPLWTVLMLQAWHERWA